MDYLQDYWTYLSCYEIPRNYALWSAIGLVSSLVHRKVAYYHGHIEINGILYVGLIGPQGSSKSTCCSHAKRLFMAVAPDANIGPSRASPEVLVKMMNDKEFVRSITNHRGEAEEVRPYAFFINEFKNFLGRSPYEMINFITDVWGEKAYDASTIVRGKEYVINPAITILMCETADWFISNMRGTLITGGIARRFILVNELYGDVPKPFIEIPPEANAALDRVKQRLIDIRPVYGEFKWGNGTASYDAWYRDNFKLLTSEENGMIRGYLKSKNTLLYTTMMLLDVVSDKPMFLFTADLFDHALALLNSPEKNLPKLALAAGRNEMMGPQQKILETLRTNKGYMSEKMLMRAIESELNSTETYSVFRHLENTDQIIKRLCKIPNTNGVAIERWVVFLPEVFAEWVKAGKIKET